MKKLLLTCAALLCASTLYAGMGVDTTIASTSGSVRLGARQVIFVFSSDYTGTINGVSYNALQGATMNFGPFDMNTLDTITYTVTAGSVRIIRVQ